MRNRLSRTTLLLAILMSLALAAACVPVAPASQSGAGTAALTDVTPAAGLDAEYQSHRYLCRPGQGLV